MDNMCQTLLSFHQSLLKILEKTTQIEPNGLLIKLNQIFLKVQCELNCIVLDTIVLEMSETVKKDELLMETYIESLKGQNQ